MHADLHAGNMLVRDLATTITTTTTAEDGSDVSGAGVSQLKKDKSAPTTVVTTVTPTGRSRPRLVLLDAGLVVELRPEDRRNFVSLFRAVIDNDGRRVARLIMEYSPRSTSTISPSAELLTDTGLECGGGGVINPEVYEQEMADLVSYVHAQGLSLGKTSVSALLRQVLHLSYEHNVKLESRFVTVIVAMMLAEGMGRRLDPDVNIILRATPYIRNAALNALLNN